MQREALYRIAAAALVVQAATIIGLFLLVLSFSFGG